MKYTARAAERAEWNSLLARCPADYSLSQTYEFGEALGKAYPEYAYEPRILEFEDGVTMLVPLVRVRRMGGLLRCFEAMPFSLDGRPVALGGSMQPVHLALALGLLKADSIYLNSGGAGSTDLPALNEFPITIQSHSTHILDLGSGFDEIWRTRFSGKVRNQCRAASKKGVEVFTASGPEDFDAYYSIYAASATRWGYDQPPYPRELFQAFGHLQGAGVELKLARVSGKIIAGILLLRGKRSILYWSGAMLKEHAEYSANNALLAAAIEQACLHGMTAFDFGGSGEMPALKRFKESFGAETRSYQSLVLHTQRYKLATSARSALARVGI